MDAELRGNVRFLFRAGCFSVLLLRIQESIVSVSRFYRGESVFLVLMMLTIRLYNPTKLLNLIAEIALAYKKWPC